MEKILVASAIGGILGEDPYTQNPNVYAPIYGIPTADRVRPTANPVIYRDILKTLVIIL